VNILFVVPYAPTLIRTRSYNLIRALAGRGHALTVATLYENEDEHLFLESLADADIQVVSAPLTKVRKASNLLGALPSRTPLQANYCWQPSLARYLNLQLATCHLQPDIIHVEHLRGARHGLLAKSAICNLQSAIPIVWDSVDCISYLFEQAAQHSRSVFGKWVTRLELARTRRFEGWLLSQFDRVLVTSKIDKQALECLAPLSQGWEPRGGALRAQRLIGSTLRWGLDKLDLTTQGNAYSARRGGGPALPPGHRDGVSTVEGVRVLPNGVDLNYFKPRDDHPRDPATLVLSGKMSYHANVSMALYLIREIMPVVWEARPDVRVLIVGKDPSRDIQALNAHPVISVTGTVEDIRPYLWKATLAVAPTTYGAGIQNKVLEAMACATPVVASPQAVSALEAVPGRDVMVAEEPQAFAEVILQLLADPTKSRQIGQAGRQYVERYHNWEHIAERLESIYHEVIQTRHSQPLEN